MNAIRRALHTRYQLAPNFMLTMTRGGDRLFAVQNFSAARLRRSLASARRETPRSWTAADQAAPPDTRSDRWLRDYFEDFRDLA